MASKSTYDERLWYILQRPKSLICTVTIIKALFLWIWSVLGSNYHYCVSEQACSATRFCFERKPVQYYLAVIQDSITSADKNQKNGLSGGRTLIHYCNLAILEGSQQLQISVCVCQDNALIVGMPMSTHSYFLYHGYRIQTSPSQKKGHPLGPPPSPPFETPQ